VLKLFVEMDKNFYKDCRDQVAQKEKEREEIKQKRLKAWADIEKEANAADVL
jgi:hypothetical protein